MKKLSPINFVYALSFAFFLCSQAGRVLLSLDALHFGASSFDVGALSATFSAFPLAFAWIAGRLADRFGSRWLLTAAAAGACVGLMVPFLLPKLPALYLAAASLGLSFCFFNVSVQNLVGILGKQGDHARHFSNFTIVAAFANFFGPMTSGFSIDHLGFGPASVVLALIALVPIPMLLWRGGTLPAGRPRKESVGSLRGMFVAPGVFRVLATSSLVVLGMDQFQFYLPIYGYHIKLSASEIGVILSMFSGASFVVRLIMPWLVKRYGEETVLAYAFSISAASFFCMPFFENAVALSAIAFLFGLGLGCGQPITMMMTYNQSPKDRSGEALGLRQTANHLARVVGPLVFGSLGSALGLFAVFWGNATMMVSGGIASWRGARRKAD